MLHVQGDLALRPLIYVPSEEHYLNGGSTDWLQKIGILNTFLHPYMEGNFALHNVAFLWHISGDSCSHTLTEFSELTVVATY